MTSPFIDTFNGAGATTNLESWTPTGGTAWTLVTGTAGAAQVRTTGGLACAASGTYTCDDQGSENHYVSFRQKLQTSYGNYVCARFVDASNWIGFRTAGTGATSRRFQKNVGGTITSISETQSVDEQFLKIECETVAGDVTVRVYEGGTGGSPSWTQIGSDLTVTDAVFDGETSIGLNIGVTTSAAAWIDDFEAGALAGGGVPTLSLPTYAPGSLTSAGFRPRVTAT